MQNCDCPSRRTQEHSQKTVEAAAAAVTAAKRSGDLRMSPSLDDLRRNLHLQPIQQQQQQEQQAVTGGLRMDTGSVSSSSASSSSTVVTPWDGPVEIVKSELQTGERGYRKSSRPTYSQSKTLPPDIQVCFLIRSLASKKRPMSHVTSILN